MNHCKYIYQGLTFYGVNAHNKIGWSEHQISSLQDLVLHKIIHAYCWWPSEFPANLHTYAVRHAYEIINNTPCHCIIYKSTPTQMFSKSKVNSKPRNCQPIFSPMYALLSDLASYQHVYKQKDKSTKGIYLEMSTIHTKTLALVLNLTDGSLSSHLQIAFDTPLQHYQWLQWKYCITQILSGHVRVCKSKEISVHELWATRPINYINLSVILGSQF